MLRALVLPPRRPLVFLALVTSTLLVMVAVWGCATSRQHSGTERAPPASRQPGIASPAAAPSSSASSAGEPSRSEPHQSKFNSGPPETSDQAPALSDEEFLDEWEWVKTRFPWVAEARPTHEVLNALLSWAQPGKELTVYDLRCNGVRVVRRHLEGSDGRFEGRIVRHTQFFEGELGLEKWVSVDYVELANRITVYCGNGELYRRGAKGQWLSAGSQGFGCVRELAHGLNPPIQLSRVSADAAWYAGIWVSYPEDCRAQIAEVDSCFDGPRRSCLICREWGPGSSVTPIPTIHTTRRVDCSRPCPTLTPPQALAHDVRRARRALDGRHLVRHLDFKPPEVFRTRAACQAYRKEHKNLVVQQTWLDR